MDAEPVVRRRRVQQAPEPKRGGARPKRRSSGSAGPGSKAGKAPSPKQGAKAGNAPTKQPRKKQPQKKQSQKKGAGGSAGSSGKSSTPAVAGFLIRPDTSGHKVKLGLAWFAAALGSLLLGRWAITALWAAVAVLAAWQVTGAWMQRPRAEGAPGFSPALAAVGAGSMVCAAGIGTSLAGLGLIVVPLAVVGVVMGSGRKPAAAGAALIGAVLAAIPAVSVILVARDETWAALFLVAAVSFYDAGYFIGAAESSSRLEGPVTGGIGLLAVTFTASAFEAPPFDRATAWIAGVLILAACPLGQMLTSAELPEPGAKVPAMRRLDSYLVAAPLMVGAVWALG
ncbi:MAG: hypothetical protein KDB31_13820 [Microthrixaceae bacterium]|nr:hypothetical protein [Microthrixaceae bacterium]